MNGPGRKGLVARLSDWIQWRKYEPERNISDKSAREVDNFTL